VLALLTALGLAYALWRYPDTRARSLNEALFIAAVLTLTVDPFLKKRLAKEASKDIFHHLLGLDLPPEIRERLKSFVFEQKYYRSALEIDAHAEKKQDHSVHLRVRVRATIVAICDCDYTQILGFEEFENPSIAEVSVTSHLKEHTYAYPNSQDPTVPVPKGVADEPMVLEWKGKTLRLAKGETLSSFFDFTIQGSEKDFWVQHFGTTTVNPRVRLSASDDLEICASKPERTNGTHEYIYERVYVPGDHIQIRWRPRNAASSAPTKPTLVPTAGAPIPTPITSDPESHAQGKS
jgi:hypothetical protein